jgi:DNA repair protein RecO (recombination protein O)
MVVFLTPDHGKRKAWAYGARAIRSRFGAALEPLAKVRIGYSERESEEVLRIESVDLVRSLFPRQQKLASSVAATYIAELVDTFAPADDPAELIYRLLDRACGTPRRFLAACRRHVRRGVDAAPRRHLPRDPLVHRMR